MLKAHSPLRAQCAEGPSSQVAAPTSRVVKNGRVRPPKPWKNRGGNTWKPGAPRRPCLSVAHEGGRRCHPQRDSTMVGMARRPSSSAQRRLPVTRTRTGHPNLLVPGGVNLKCRSAPTYDRSCCQTGRQTETRRKRTSLDMIQNARHNNVEEEPRCQANLALQQ